MLDMTIKRLALEKVIELELERPLMPNELDLLHFFYTKGYQDGFGLAKRMIIEASKEDSK
jgi:hypothetical protein